jgi:galactokinase
MTIPKLSHASADLSDAEISLVNTAKQLYQDRLAYFAQTHQPPAYVCVAPGRVNLIGEHVDYQDGFVLPCALSGAYSTAVYGTGFLHTGKSNGATTIRIRLCSDQADVPEMVEERRLSGSFRPPSESSWVNYVVGVIVQYMPDIPQEGCVLDLAMAYSSTVPLGAGLSSSAALEVVTACFLECFLHDGMAYSSVLADASVDTKVTRALRCQTAENTWANSPCGIMDQFIVSFAQKGHFLLLDCRDLSTTQVPMKCQLDSDAGGDEICILIANSNVQHAISDDSTYGLRRRECAEAVSALQSVPLYHVESTLREATIQDLDVALQKGKLDDTLYKRAHHVVSENVRTKECATALKLGLWHKVGSLMTASHVSLRDDYQVSCPELDILVDIANQQEGVYGSRMTGGGFGGCTVTLVQKECVAAVVDLLKAEYKEATGKECTCFVTTPGQGARVLAIDMDCKPESDFFKKK